MKPQPTTDFPNGDAAGHPTPLGVPVAAPHQAGPSSSVVPDTGSAGSPSAGAGTTDRALLSAARDGSKPAFEELVRRFRPRLVRLAVHMVRDAALAQDVVQETFVRTLRALDQFDGRSEPYTWIYRICVNLSLNALRSRRAHQRASSLDDDRLAALSVADSQPASGSPESRAQDRQRYAALCQAMDELSDSLRTTIILVCVDGTSHEDAAQILGVSEGTVAWRVHEARKRLREHLVAGGWDVAP